MPKLRFGSSRSLLEISRCLIGCASAHAARLVTITCLITCGFPLLVSQSVCDAQELDRAVESAFFESKIRPLLEKHCLECHSGDNPKGDLRLTDRSSWVKAGVIKPGDPTNSPLLTVVQSEDNDVRMPPPNKQPLSKSEIAALREWISRGAYDPREPMLTEQGNALATGPKKRNRNFEITDEDRKYWAFQPLNSVAWAADEQVLTASQKIDLLIARHHSLQPEDIQSAPPRELVRRLFADLWGLPATFEHVYRFEKFAGASSSRDNDPGNNNAAIEKEWETLIEELLDSHHYGERWGRHWLDWVRYAETNGYERDGMKPHVWRYRDYVIDSFRDDKPYDQFVIEQLAGDEWLEVQGWTAKTHPKEWRDAIIATGFYRLHIWDDEPDDTDLAEFEDADDTMVAIGSAFLGLTLGCARCHDHKFDPISQNDYYSLLKFMRGIDPYGLSRKGGGGRGTGRIQRFLVPDEESAQWEQDRQSKILLKQSEFDAATDPAVRLKIQGELKELRDLVPPFDAALSVAEQSGGPKPTHVLHRGDPHATKEPVDSRVPEVLQLMADIPMANGGSERQGKSFSKSCGLRLKLAQWVVHPRNPLTARVMVNKIWQRHFGVGIVPTPDDFGRTGQPPSNPALLDFLAKEFIESGWSIKQVHRMILSTKAYRSRSQSVSGFSDPAYYQPQLRRLDAEGVRDSVLAVAGELGSKKNGPSVYPSLTQEIRDSANPVSVSAWQDSPIEDQKCRSVYLVVKRSLRVPFLEILDFTNSTAPTAIRNVTTTAPQALLLLNDPWMQERSLQLARRLGDLENPEARIRKLWQLAYQREPNPEEIRIATEYIARLRGPRTAEQPEVEQAWISLCRAILNSNEFLYVD